MFAAVSVMISELVEVGMTFASCDSMPWICDATSEASTFTRGITCVMYVSVDGTSSGRLPNSTGEPDAIASATGTTLYSPVPVRTMVNPRTCSTEFNIWKATSSGTGSGAITVIGPVTCSALMIVTPASRLSSRSRKSMSSP